MLLSLARDSSIFFCYNDAMKLNVFLLTLVTMMAFAANSIFCRLSLIDSANSPLSFTLVRLFFGALPLSFYYFKTRLSQPCDTVKATFIAPMMLFTYALFFSLAYVQIDAGSGALILFASVQLTMLGAAFMQGTRLRGLEIVGVALAISGFVYLMLPGARMPALRPAVFMCLSGVAWGVYSLIGQRAQNPVSSTARNFVFTVPLTLVLALIFSLKLSFTGFLWAAISGALTSALGYVLWYRVLRQLTTSTAAIVQLSVPAFAAFGGILFLGEHIHFRLMIASLIIFIGIGLKSYATAKVKDRQ